MQRPELCARFCDSWQKLVHLLHNSLMQIMAPAYSWHTDYTRTLASLPRLFSGMAKKKKKKKGTFSSYGAAIPAWSADFSHIIMALRTKLCYVFSFLDNFPYGNNAPFSHKAGQQRLVINVLIDFPHTLIFITIRYNLVFKYLPQKSIR